LPDTILTRLVFENGLLFQYRVLLLTPNQIRLIAHNKIDMQKQKWKIPIRLVIKADFISLQNFSLTIESPLNLAFVQHLGND
jgi:hypothetical protein